MKCVEDNLFEHRFYLKYMTTIPFSLEIEGEAPEHLETVSEILAPAKSIRMHAYATA